MNDIDPHNNSPVGNPKDRCVCGHLRDEHHINIDTGGTYCRPKRVLANMFGIVLVCNCPNFLKEAERKK